LQGGGIWAVVKADGYGHGAAVVARAALDAGAIGVAVATLGEAQALRPAVGDARILILSPLDPGEEPAAAGYEVTISSVDAWRRLRDAGHGVVHVKVETGMGRWGLDAADARAVAWEVAVDRTATLAGLMSHLATSEQRHDPYVASQRARFLDACCGLPACPRHLANSGGVLYHPSTRLDTARCGIAIYGISPGDEDPQVDSLTPALTWTSEVRAVRVLAAGESSGYGRRIAAHGPTRLAMVPVGYADGYPRNGFGDAWVLVGGHRHRVGTVAMDQLAVIITGHQPVAVGDEVTLIGGGGASRVGIEQLAAAAGTIGYEVACGLHARPQRSRRIVVDA
jgi:alanine racemase